MNDDSTFEIIEPNMERVDDEEVKSYFKNAGLKLNLTDLFIY